MPTLLKENVFNASITKPSDSFTDKYVYLYRLFFIRDILYTFFSYLNGKDILCVFQSSKMLIQIINNEWKDYARLCLGHGRLLNSTNCRLHLRRWWTATENFCVVCLKANTNALRSWECLTLCEEHRTYTYLLPKTYCKAQYGLNEKDMEFLSYQNKGRMKLYFVDEVLYIVKQKYGTFQKYRQLRLHKVKLWLKREAMKKRAVHYLQKLALLAGLPAAFLAHLDFQNIFQTAIPSLDALYTDTELTESIVEGLWKEYTRVQLHFHFCSFYLKIPNFYGPPTKGLESANALNTQIIKSVIPCRKVIMAVNDDGMSFSNKFLVEAVDLFRRSPTGAYTILLNELVRVKMQRQPNWTRWYHIHRMVHQKVCRRFATTFSNVQGAYSVEMFFQLLQQDTDNVYKSILTRETRRITLYSALMQAKWPMVAFQRSDLLHLYLEVGVPFSAGVKIQSVDQLSALLVQQYKQKLQAKDHVFQWLKTLEMSLEFLLWSPKSQYCIDLFCEYGGVCISKDCWVTTAETLVRTIQKCNAYLRYQHVCTFCDVEAVRQHTLYDTHNILFSLLQLYIDNGFIQTKTKVLTSVSDIQNLIQDMTYVHQQSYCVYCNTRTKEDPLVCAFCTKIICNYCCRTCFDCGAILCVYCTGLRYEKHDIVFCCI